MPQNNLMAASIISSTGMSAERLRMEVIANNLANANSTRSANGGPFRRQDVIFEAVMGESMGSGKLGNNLQGVRVVDIIEDPTEGPRVYMPGNPEADRDGFVRMPNVNIPMEMVNLLTAMRTYEANLKANQAFLQINQQAIALLRTNS